jgi:hypothetical protein
VKTTRTKQKKIAHEREIRKSLRVPESEVNMSFQRKAAEIAKVVMMTMIRTDMDIWLKK